MTTRTDVVRGRHRRQLAAMLLSATASLTLAAPALAKGHGHRPHDRSFQFAEMGDTEYSDEGVDQFANMTDDINAQKNLQWVVHVGDIKGAQPCSDSWLEGVRAQFQKYDAPFVYTPGDNEWTDCHMTALGQFLPTERLARLRQIFFPVPGLTLGKRTMRVTTQASEAAYAPFVENVRWVREGVVFATIDVPGSGNDLNPWFGIDKNDTVETPRPDRITEYKTRMAAVLAWLDETFAFAERIHAPGVFIAMEAYP